jgi:hypothetical protein
MGGSVGQTLVEKQFHDATNVIVVRCYCFNNTPNCQAKVANARLTIHLRGITGYPVKGHMKLPSSLPNNISHSV